MLSKQNIKQLEDLILKHQEIEKKISDPEIISDNQKYQELLKKHSELKEAVESFNTYKHLLQEKKDTEELIKDPEMKEIATEELNSINQKIDKIQNALIKFLIPPDPDDQKNAIVEIRAGTGGEEAALFAGNLFRMYSRYAERENWKIEILSETLASHGGIKEISFIVTGQGAFRKLKYESGTHRVQRVPETESSGRIHTSAATVAIMPEAQEVDIKIDSKDLRIDTYRASGAGGQHVNKTSSAIRITHIPTNTVVACQDERSQFQNKDKAMRLLRSKLYELQIQKNQLEQANLRKIQVGTGDRSEKIRTYNYPQSRITDHRINLTLYSLEDQLNGNLAPIIDALITADSLKKLNQ